MTKTKPRDNSTYREKVTLRKQALSLLAEQGVTEPVVCETHGGEGKIFNACYAHLERGIVFEQNEKKAGILAMQRPTWSVLQGDSISALRAGIGGHLTVDLLDVDPYGAALDVIEAFFSSRRPFARRMAVAANCGGRQKLTINGGWLWSTMRPIVEKYGNDGLHGAYLEICKELVTGYVAHAGYQVSHFAGYYAGVNAQITHYLVMLERS